MNDVRPAIERAIELLGSQAKLARAVGCSQQMVSQLLVSGRITAEMAIKIDRSTGGQVPRHKLRPDLFEVPDPETKVA